MLTIAYVRYTMSIMYIYSFHDVLRMRNVIENAYVYRCRVRSYFVYAPPTNRLKIATARVMFEALTSKFAISSYLEVGLLLVV